MNNRFVNNNHCCKNKDGINGDVIIENRKVLFAIKKIDYHQKNSFKSQHPYKNQGTKALTSRNFSIIKLAGFFRFYCSIHFSNI